MSEVRTTDEQFAAGDERAALDDSFLPLRSMDRTTDVTARGAAESLHCAIVVPVIPTRLSVPLLLHADLSLASAVTVDLTSPFPCSARIAIDSR